MRSRPLKLKFNIPEKEGDKLNFPKRKVINSSVVKFDQFKQDPRPSKSR